MTTEIIVPKVDMVMDSAVFVEWLKHEGDWVKKGEPLFVILTDKSNIEIEAPASGRLAELHAKADDVIPVTQVIGYVLEEAESVPQSTAYPQPPPAKESVTPAFMSAKPPETNAPETARATITGTKQRATPVARRLARELGIDLNGIRGRGPAGRIQKADVEAFEPVRQEESKWGGMRLVQPARRIPLPQARQKSVVPLSGVRKIAAERIVQSAFTAPHISLSLHVDMTEVIRLRDRLLEPLLARTGSRLTYTAIMARAVAAVLPNHGLLNATLDSDKIIQWEDIHLGIATNLEENLIVPVIRNAEQLKLEQIAITLADLSERGRTRHLTPSEMTGSTFTISNLGMYGVDSFTPIINPPESAILAIGKIMESPVRNGTSIEFQPTANLTVSADHRIADGATVARFLTELKATLENPYLLL